MGWAIGRSGPYRWRIVLTEELGRKRLATASYMEELIGELATMGRNIDCDFLVFLLEMAQQEAKNIVRENPTPGRPGMERSSLDGENRGLTADELAALFLRKPPSRN